MDDFLMFYKAKVSSPVTLLSASSERKTDGKDILLRSYLLRQDVLINDTAGFTQIANDLTNLRGQRCS
ncbi:hypothetical protein ILYODFUR_036964, partial [Ilyodon furcidens]